MIKSVILAFSLLMTSPTFAGKEDSEEFARDVQLKLASIVQKEGLLEMDTSSYQEPCFPLAVAGALPQDSHLRELRFYDPSPLALKLILDKTPRLEALSFYCIGWPEDVAVDLAFDAIQRHPGLRKLSIGDTRYKSETPLSRLEVMRRLASALKNHPSLKELKIPNINLAPEDTTVLGSVLPTIPNLSDFEIFANHTWGSKGFEIISQHLALCKKMEKVKVSACDLDQSSVPSLLSLVEARRETLRVLTLRSNPQVQAIYPVVQVLEKCPHLEEVCVDHVDQQSAHGLAFLTLRSKRKIYTFYDGYNIGCVIDSTLLELAHYMELHGMVDKGPVRDDKDRNRRQAAFDAFIDRLSTQPLYLLSDPLFAVLLMGYRFKSLPSGEELLLFQNKE